MVRSVAKDWDNDRFMAPDIQAVTELLQDGKVRVAAILNNYGLPW